jgi:hypothetical protein
MHAYLKSVSLCLNRENKQNRNVRDVNKSLEKNDINESLGKQQQNSHKSYLSEEMKKRLNSGNVY